MTESQKECLNEIKNSTNNKVLLYGVTGSGKTEIYINLIKSYLKNNKSIIMLVPEISLTPQIVSRYHKYPIGTGKQAYRQRKSNEVHELHHGLRQTLVWSAYGRTSAHCLLYPDQLLVEKI